MNKLRTSIIMGSAFHNAYVHENVYEIAKAFSSLLPAVTYTEKELVRYEVPHSQISRGAIEEGKYHIEMDNCQTLLRTTGYKPVQNPVVLKLDHPSNRSEFDRVTIYQQQILPAFLIKGSASFSHCEYIHDRLIAQIEGWGYHWDVICQKQWVCPYYAPGDEKTIVFRCRPVYSVEILVDGLPEGDTIKRFIETGLPRYFWGDYNYCASM